MSYRMKCFNPNCLDRSCNEMQYCGESFNFKKPNETSKKKNTITTDSSSSDTSAGSLSYEKSKKLKASKSKSSVSSNSKLSESDSDSSSGDSLFSSSSDSLFSSSSSTSSVSASFSEQVVPNLIKRKNNKPSGVNPSEEDDIVIIECKDPKCTDPNCNVQLVQSGHKCNNLNCSDKDCIPSTNSSLSSNCTDPHCSSCENGHDHNSSVRNTFLGIAGIILFAMIGYMTFIKIKARRSRNAASKGYLPTEMIKN